MYHSHIEKKMARPVAFSASRMGGYRTRGGISVTNDFIRGDLIPIKNRTGVTKRNTDRETKRKGKETNEPSLLQLSYLR